MRFNCQPGHNARVRKDGSHFYRECVECGTSERFHQNSGSWKP
jgi:RNase P subunit RPR2